MRPTDQDAFRQVIADHEAGQGDVLTDVNLAILRTLQEAGLEIPFPQRVVRQG